MPKKHEDQYRPGDLVRWVKAVDPRYGRAQCVEWFRGRAMRGNKVLIKIERSNSSSFAVPASELEPREDPVETMFKEHYRKSGHSGCAGKVPSGRRTLGRRFNWCKGTPTVTIKGLPYCIKHAKQQQAG